ncbi:unnamed protein product [Hymenolepis diminuta]|uniref:DUF7083 domain-containing protein n=1 Tax=Hymenolepis diminuta TaxID=6216 RepID=A0A564YWE4_HYMDI|nr:unnamed protein product [Hymenolepis diminuta]
MNLWKPDKDPEDYVKNVGEFHYEPTVGEVFATWYIWNRDVFENRMAGLSDETRITKLSQKLNKSDHNLYLAYLPPLSPKDLTFEETIQKRYKCHNSVTHEGEGIHKYTGIANRMSNAFSYGSLKEDEFRCLAFIQDLRPAMSTCYVGIRVKLLSALDKNPDAMLHNLVAEYNNFRSLIVDSNMIESNENVFNSPNYKPGCRFNWGYHLHRDRAFFKHQWQDCNSYGHKEGSCQRSQRRPHPSYRTPYALMAHFLSYRLTLG